MVHPLPEPLSPHWCQCPQLLADLRQLLVRTYLCSWIYLGITAILFLTLVVAFLFMLVHSWDPDWHSAMRLLHWRKECWCTWKDTHLCWTSSLPAWVFLAPCLVLHHGVCLVHQILKLEYHQQHCIYWAYHYRAHQSSSRTCHPLVPLKWQSYVSVPDKWTKECG